MRRVRPAPPINAVDPARLAGHRAASSGIGRGVCISAVRARRLEASLYGLGDIWTATTWLRQVVFRFASPLSAV